MKEISIVMMAVFIISLLNVRVFAQNKSELNTTIIEPYRLPITFYKTTNLIFPYAIKSVDRGSKDILAQKAKGVDNVLQLKAGKQGFEQTNLTVITADGKLYSYLLDYSDTPGVLNIRFTSKAETKRETFFPNTIISETQMQAEAETVINETRNIHGIKDKSYGIKILIDGLFINDDVLYCRIMLQNNSNINYGIEQLRFYIRDQKKSKLTATQELEINPLYVNGDTAVVTAQTEKVFVFALPKFTIPDKKYLAIELMEKSGGRHLKLKVSNRTIIKVKTLSY
ncbi:MAG: conjugative transposon protein TraN [Chitinophagaceae bacterium]|nr:conjugative transposon protein TraN [Chitinophagaceae bacterium]